MYVVHLLDEAHGHEDIAHHVTGINQAGLHLIETGIGRIDVFLLDLHLIVFLALGTIVGLFPLLRLRNSLFVIGVWDRFVGSCDRKCLFLRLVLLYLRQSLDDVALLLLFLVLLDEQFTQLGHFTQKLIHLVLEEGVLLLEHTDNLVLFHTTKVRKKNETTKEKSSYF